LQGSTGSTGPIGPTGFLVSGSSAGNTPYWNGSAWITNNSNIYNHGSAVGIGTTAPKGALDINSATAGVLVPRVSLTARNVAAPIVNPQGGSLIAGTLIWNTATTGTTPNNVSPGYYYWDGSAWKALSGNASNNWSIAGNTGIDPFANFIGTADNTDVIFKRDNVRAGYIGFTNLSFGVNALNPSGTGAGNTALGISALFSNTTGDFNTAIGISSLHFNTTGYNNTGIGSQALYSNTTGYYNTASGSEALQYNTSGYNNTAGGFKSLFLNTTGSFNTANGVSALYSNTTGIQHTAIGNQSLYSNTTGYSNTAVGFQSLYANTTGFLNTAEGAFSLSLNTTGHYNTAEGSEALENNTTGNANTATGESALYSNKTGNSNTASGWSALLNSTSDNNTAVGSGSAVATGSGFQNTSMGANSLVNNVTGSYNTAIGYNTGPNSANLSNTTCIGIDATATATDMVRIGNVFVNSIGGQVGWTTLSDGRFKQNIKEDVPGLAFINQLRPVTYQINRESVNRFIGVDDKKTEPVKGNSGISSTRKTEVLSATTTGFVAQEVEAAAKKIGFDFSGVDAPQNENAMYGLRYDEFVVPLVKAVQELTKQNEELLKRIEALEKK